MVLQLPRGEELQWFAFDHPRQILVATRLSQVPAVLASAEAAASEGLFAVGFVAYEAAAAFDRAQRTRPRSTLPLAWFGIFAEPCRLTALTSSHPGTTLDWEPQIDESSYRDAVRKIRHHIAAGDTYQINLTFPLSAPLTAEPWDVFVAMCRNQRASCCAFIDTPDFALCSASPELFFALEGNRLACRPMKGTAPRGRTLAEDEQQAAWLARSDKNRAENIMILDMVRNDLGRIAEPGTVRVRDLCQVERYPSLFQMISTVEARTGASIVEIFRALFPSASITGAPKIRAMELIAEIEDRERGVYTGAIGVMGPGRRARFNVAIRTVQIDRRRQRALYGTGGGIVWDSLAEQEWQECQTKALVLSAPVAPFSLLETIRWDPGAGFHLLERHLQRLTTSARYFDIPLDPSSLLSHLENATASLPPRPHRIRLLVDGAGAPSVETTPLELGPRLLRVALATSSVDNRDRFLFHKTTHRELYDHHLHSFPDHDDVVLWNDDGWITEACLANVIVCLAGRWVTPPVDCGLLAGTLRGHLLDRGVLEERRITVPELCAADALELVNSVRGRMPAVLDCATVPDHIRPGSASRES